MFGNFFNVRSLLALIAHTLLWCNFVQANKLQVGFAQVPVTPSVIDEWVDVNNDAQFDPDIDTWTDKNGNGVFDPVWIAGFQKGRAAQGIKDDLMAVAVVIDDGDQRMAVVSVDTIGLMRKFVLDVRQSTNKEWGLDHLMIHATHNHEGPDTQGLWGPGLFESGINQDYMRELKGSILSVIETATSNLEPAEMYIARIAADPRTSIYDKRKPIVIDDDIRVLLFRRPDQSVIGTVVNFGIHVELAWDKNLLLTSDVAGYLRRGISEGIYYEEELRMPGLGGTTLWLTGNIGGLMTSGPSDPVYDVFLQEKITEAGHHKARAFGYGLAKSVIDAAEQDSLIQSQTPRLTIKTREIELGIDNLLLSIATLMGLVDSDPTLHLTPPFVRYLSEVTFIQLGEATITAIPGELYPEIAVGGIENPDGADYFISPQEIPPLRSQLPGRVNLMVNLANDAIGYIIPKSEWDNSAPWIYGEDEETYGEVVSLGSETAPAIHSAVVEIINDHD
jgi:hypothetical protein